MSRCPNIGGDALDLHPRCVLESLRASGCNGLRSVVMQLPAEAPLRALNLESCRQLHEVGWLELDSLHWEPFAPVVAAACSARMHVCSVLPACTSFSSAVLAPHSPEHELLLSPAPPPPQVVLVAHHLESANFSHCGQLRTISLRCRCAPGGLLLCWFARTHSLSG